MRVDVAQEPNPTAARRELALYFRTQREQHKYGLDQLAEYLGVSEAQASRLDKGARGLRPDDVRRLADWYRLPDAERDRLMVLASKSRRRGWWQQVDLDDSYRTLIGMEQAAHSINEYCGSVIPGLLQTRDYAVAAGAAGALDVPQAQIDLAIEVRMRRQQVLERDNPPQLWVVLDESALARVAGGPSVMGAQLQYLMAAADRPGVTVQVIGFEYGVHPGGDSNFIMIDSSAGLPGLVYVEGLRGHWESTMDHDIRRYRRIWDVLRALALNPRESRDRIAQHIELLSS
jgi:transcriptional regulator with XRE-family HTH domain